jgi:hypothetical protein
MNYVFGNSQSLSEASSSQVKTETALQALVIAAMAVAVAASLFTCSVAVNTYSTQDVNNVMRLLAGMKFTCSVSGNNLTVIW